MKTAIFKSTGMSDLRSDQIYYFGDIYCAMTSDEIRSITEGGFEKYWYDIEVLDKY